jgi:hypothetical protein
VLEGAAKTLDRYRPVLLAEIIDYQLKAMGSSPLSSSHFSARTGTKLILLMRKTSSLIQSRVQ